MREESLVEEDKASLSRSAGLVSFATALSRITGALSLIIIFKALGYNRLQDSYNLANVMPNMIYELIAGGVLTSVLIPIYISKRLESENEGWRTAGNIINITMLVLVVMALLGTFFSYYFVRLQTFLVSVDDVGVARVNFFFKFFVWEIVFYGLTAIFNAILQAHRKFVIPAMAPVVNNIVVIITAVFFYVPLRDSNPEMALTALAIGTTLGIAAMALIQIPYLFKIGWRYVPVFDLRDPALRHLGILALPVIAYVAGNQIGLTVSNALAWRFDGGMSAFKQAWQFFQMPFGLLAVPVSTVLFPPLAERAALKDMRGFKKTLTHGINTTAFVIIPASVGLFLLSKPITGLIYADILKSVGMAGVDQIAGVMAYFMAGLLPFSLFMFLNRVFYSLHDTRTPMLVNTLGVPLNIGLDFLLVGFFGVSGLSMGHSLTYLFTMSLLFIALRRKIGALDGRDMFKKAVRFVMLSVAMMGIIALTAYWVDTWGLADLAGRAAVVALSTAAGGTFYLVLSKLMHTEEISFLTSVFKGMKKGGRK